MKFKRIITIDETDYDEVQIKEMNFEQVHMLISFIDNEKDLNRIKDWRKDCLQTECYINELLFNIESIRNKFN